MQMQINLLNVRPVVSHWRHMSPSTYASPVCFISEIKGEYHILSPHVSSVPVEGQRCRQRALCVESMCGPRDDASRENFRLARSRGFRGRRPSWRWHTTQKWLQESTEQGKKRSLCLYRSPAMLTSDILIIGILSVRPSVTLHRNGLTLYCLFIENTSQTYAQEKKSRNHTFISIW